MPNHAGALQGRFFPAKLETEGDDAIFNTLLKRDYYCQAQQALQQPTTGRAFLEALKNVQTSVFQREDKSIDVVEQAWNELDVERENWTTTYLQSMRFVASPEGTEVKERKPGLALGVVLGGLLGGMLGMFIALVRAWWKNEDAGGIV